MRKGEQKKKVKEITILGQMLLSYPLVGVYRNTLNYKL